MTLNIIIFGPLAEITGCSNLTLSGFPDSEQLIAHLQHLYPGLKKAKYAIAVDKRLTDKNTKLENGSTIALLPPFSGG